MAKAAVEATESLGRSTLRLVPAAAGTEEAAGMLAEADAVLPQNTAAAALGYLALVDRFPASTEARLAETTMRELGKRLIQGEIPAAVTAPFLAGLPDPSTLSSPKAKYWMTDIYRLAGEAAERAGDPARATALREECVKLSGALRQELRNSQYQLLLTRNYVLTARALGRAAYLEAIGELQRTLRDAERPDGSVFAARAELALHYMNENNPGEAWLEHASLIEQFEGAPMDAILADSSVEDGVKAHLLFRIGYAHYHLNEWPEAITAFDAIQERFPTEGEPTERAAYYGALVRYFASGEDADTGVEAFVAALDRYPTGAHTDAALFMLGKIYQTAGDLASAHDAYSYLLNAFPHSAFITSVSVLQEQAATALAEQHTAAAPISRDIQTCGPEALRLLLARRGLDIPVRALVALTGCGADGATIEQLAAGSTAAGLTTAGYTAAPDALPPAPSVALLNGAHFVFVQSAGAGGVTIQDGNGKPENLSPGEFQERWTGHLLVPCDIVPARATLMTESQLAQLRGGIGNDEWPPDVEAVTATCENSDKECPKCDPCCENGGSGPARTGFAGPPDGGPAPPGGSGGACPPNPPPGGPGDLHPPSPPSVNYIGAPLSLNPSSLIRLGCNTAGINGYVDMTQFAQLFTETDVSAPVQGGLALHFTRTYHNPWGFHRGYFGDGAWPYRLVLGESWTHNYNAHLRLSSELGFALFINDYGDMEYFYRTAADVNGWDYYTKSPSELSMVQRGMVLARNRSTGEFTMHFPGQFSYHFSAPINPTVERYCRLTAVENIAGDQVTLEYDDENESTQPFGRLIRVKAPGYGTQGGDNRKLEFSYYAAPNQIQSVQFYSGQTLERQIDYDIETFQYNGYWFNELRTVTVDERTVQYAYGMTWAPGQDWYARWISRVTDRKGNYTDFETTYGQTGGTTYAYQLDTAYPNGLATEITRTNWPTINYSRTVRNLDGQTALSKYIMVADGNSAGTGVQSFSFYHTPTGGTYDYWSYSYTDDAGLDVIVAPGNISLSTRSYTAQGRLASVGVPNGWSTTYNYDDPDTDLFPASVTWPDGTATTYAYDGLNRITQAAHPSNSSSSPPDENDGYRYGYGDHNTVTSLTDPEGNVTHYVHDDRNYVTEVIAADDDPEDPTHSTHFLYDEFGQVSTVQDGRGKITEYEYYEVGCQCGGGAGHALKLVRDDDGNETVFEYDNNGNRTKVIDALDRETVYQYDSMNQLFRITAPGNVITDIEHNKLGQVIETTSPELKTTSHLYDHMGWLTYTWDGEGYTDYGHDARGNLTTVVDGNGHMTTYIYNGFNQLTEVTDPINKETHYTYDAAGRRESVAAGVNGDFDPTVYAYSETTGLLESVVYHYGQSSNTAQYFYDGAGRLQRIQDWLQGNGLRYAYDELGRLETITDYDDTVLTYAYDAVGNVESMTDYHGNVTSYSYDDLNRLHTMTAPGSKTWTFGYNALSQPVAESLPNGMLTVYGYDTRNRLELIQHTTGLFGSTVESFDYLLDDDGNITRIDEHSGAFWAYGYDDRDRLTTATYTTDWGHEADYVYAYDDGDNMTSKSEPFDENFNDENYTGWSVSTGAWSATGGSVKNTLSTTVLSYLAHAIASPDYELRFSYYNEDTSNNNYYTRCAIRNNSTTRVNLIFYPNRARLYEYNGSQDVQLDQDYAYTTAEDTWYDVVVKMDGATIKVYRAERGEEPVEILSTTAASVITGGSTFFMVPANAVSRYDDVKIIDGGTQSTWTMTPDNANELTQMTNSAQGTTIDFEYDAMGRTTEKTIGNNSAQYAWRYGSKLYSVDSNLFDEGDVTYNYGGDQKRRSRAAGGVTTGYNWDPRGNVINEETGGALTMTYIHNPHHRGRATLAQIAGSNPASGTANYFFRDRLGSSRALYDANKALTASYAYTPYGGAYASTNSGTTTHQFTGHDWDAAAGLYYAPMRFLNASASRWLSRDPLAMRDGPNVYAYVKSSPVMSTDPSGGLSARDCACHILCGVALEGLMHSGAVLCCDVHPALWITLIISTLGCHLVCGVNADDSEDDDGGDDGDDDNDDDTAGQCEQLRQELSMCGRTADPIACYDRVRGEMSDLGC